LFILDHNFWTRNTRKSIKGSSGWALGQVT